MFNKKDNGYILVTALLLLLVLTVIGLAAIGTSSIENMLSGNIRLRERNISKAEAGVEISTAVIERTVRENDTQGFTNIVNVVANDTALPDELRNTAFDPDLVNGNVIPDVVFAIDGQNVAVDIDRMYARPIPGTAMQFASAYDGVGQGIGGNFYAFYRINSTGVDLANSTADIGAIYRYVPK
ncbi:MAG TPA: hypothetical protein ENH01_01110 [Nitrospirae bacterium]|nr:hypothetical protein [Nitrospirota bacterium]